MCVAYWPPWALMQWTAPWEVQAGVSGRFSLGCWPFIPFLSVSLLPWGGDKGWESHHCLVPMQGSDLLGMMANLALHPGPALPCLSG